MYPNITAAEVRSGIAHITESLCTDVRILELVTDAVTWAESRIAGNIDLTALQALATTPALWKMCLIARTRALVLGDKYGTSRTANPADINAWNEDALAIINGIIDGSFKLIDSAGTIIPAGINYRPITSNQSGVDPVFGLGDNGAYIEDKSEKSTY
jgi:hypothetical protein